MSDEPWHLSKSVPISFILAIIGQTVALIWFVATLSNDVANNKNEIIKLEVRTDNLESVVQNQAVTMARMDENIKAIRAAVERMVTK